MKKIRRLFLLGLGCVALAVVGRAAPAHPAVVNGRVHP